MKENKKPGHSQLFVNLLLRVASHLNARPTLILNPWRKLQHLTKVGWNALSFPPIIPSLPSCEKFCLNVLQRSMLSIQSGPCPMDVLENGKVQVHLQRSLASSLLQG